MQTFGDSRRSAFKPVGGKWRENVEKGLVVEREKIRAIWKAPDTRQFGGKSKKSAVMVSREKCGNRPKGFEFGTDAEAEVAFRYCWESAIKAEKKAVVANCAFFWPLSTPTLTKHDTFVVVAFEEEDFSVPVCWYTSQTREELVAFLQKLWDVPDSAVTEYKEPGAEKPDADAAMV